MKPRYDQTQLDSAWKEIEKEIKISQEVHPKAGFVNRFKTRLAEHRILVERREAYRVAILNTFVAAVLLGMILIQIFSAYDSPGDVFLALVASFSKVWVYIQMVFGIILSFGRTFPRLIPISWWTSTMAAIGGMVLVWISSIKNSLQRAGVRSI
ncbi:MAG: hypothetical protein OEY93_12675 [Anaerolineae bacterium]|nr:hypothetical protein [Anaerolineae bacterium]